MNVKGMTKFKGTIQSNVILQKLYLKQCTCKDSEQGNDNNDTEMSQ